MRTSVGADRVTVWLGERVTTDLELDLLTAQEAESVATAQDPASRSRSDLQPW